MKQKLALPLLLLVVIVLALCTYLVYQQVTQQQYRLEQNQQAIHKQLADLNDRLVAVARQQQPAGGQTGTSTAQPLRLSPAQQVQLTSQRNELKQYQRQWTLAALKLAQDHLQHNDFAEAQQILLELQQSVLNTQQDFNNPFYRTLLQTLKIDQLSIEQQMPRRQQARDSLNHALQQIQQQLNLMAVQAPQLGQAAPLKQSGIKNWLAHWFQVERASPEAEQQMLDRRFIGKQASLLVALARVALARGDATNFVTTLDEATTQLALLPDHQARQLGQQLTVLKNQPWPIPIQLTSLTLLSGIPASSAQLSDAALSDDRFADESQFEVQGQPTTQTQPSMRTQQPTQAQTQAQTQAENQTQNQSQNQTQTQNSNQVSRPVATGSP